MARPKPTVSLVLGSGGARGLAHIGVIGVLQELIGDQNIEDLPVPFTAVAADIQSGKEVWLSRGPLFDAIRASIAIPMIFTPHTIEGRQLVNGGLTHPIPIPPA